MFIPYQALSCEALNSLIESFVLREGTDYGAQEVSLADKCAAVLSQLEEGTIVISYSELSQTVTLIHKDQLSLQKSNK